jgi:CheY-like chemotaxis protein
MTQVMVVDDDEDVREALIELLAVAGIGTLAAGDGRAALALLEGGARPDLIILDIMMPEMNGPAVLERIRRHPELAKLPVVVLSALEDVYRTGADALVSYLRKPVDPDVLLAVIAAAAPG